MSAIEKLGHLVDADTIWAWETLEPALCTQIAQALAPGTLPEGVVFPRNQDDLMKIMSYAHAHNWRVLVCGSGSKLHWGGMAAGVELVVSTAHLNRLIDHAIGDLTVTAEAGMKFADLQAVLAKAGQCLAIDPLYGEQATLGGIVATADTGALRQQYGGVRDMLIGLTLVRADGQLAKAGGRVVKNVAGYDLMKLFTGSYGTLGVISQVTFRIYPVPPASRTVVLTGDPNTIAQAAAAILASVLRPVAFEVVASPTLTALGLGSTTGLLLRFHSIAVSVEQQTEQLLHMAQQSNLQAICLDSQQETALWQRLREQIGARPQTPGITCKIGVLPSQAVDLLERLRQRQPALTAGVIHARSGLGMVQCPVMSVESLAQLRDDCQTQGGFLTVLDAPPEIKQTFDLWGYPGRGLALMKQIKHQFDPQQRLNPGRFVGGI